MAHPAHAVWPTGLVRLGLLGPSPTVSTLNRPDDPLGAFRRQRGDSGGRRIRSNGGSRPSVISDASAPAPSDDTTLGRQLRTGFRWSFANTALTRVWTLALGIVLARILEPRDYGVYTVAVLALGVLQSMNELGVSIGVVQWQGDPSRVARTGVTISAATSFLLYLGCFAGAPVLASALGTPEASGVLRLLALGVLLDGISSIPNALITRALLQSRRAVADVSALAVSTAVTVVLAVNGAGAWSLAWGSLAGNIVATSLILVLAPARPRPAFDRADARHLLSYGLPLAGSSFLLFAMLNVDYFVVGRVLGPVALGFYALAFNLSSWPVNILAFSIRRVSIAGFARLASDPDRLHDRFVRSFGHLAALVVPTMVFLCLLADPLVTFVYGDRWAPAAEALRFLALLGGVRVLFDFCYDLLVATGRSRSTLGLQGLWLVVLVPALAIGTRAGGIRGAGVAHVVVAFAVVAPAFLVALHRAGISVRALAAVCARPVVAGGLAAGVTLAVTSLVEARIAVLALSGILATGVYASIVLPVADLVSGARAWGRGRSKGDAVAADEAHPGTD